MLRDLAVLRSVHRFKTGDVTAARGAAGRVQELNNGEVCFAATVTHLLLGLTAFWRGEFATADRPLDRALRLARRTDNALAETYALGYLAVSAVEGGALDDADRVVPRALERAAEPWVAEHFVAALPQLGHAALLLAAGRPGDAAVAADRGVELARRGAGQLELALALALQAQTLDATGGDGRPSLTEARTLLKGCRDPGWLPERLVQVARTLGTHQPARRPAGHAAETDGIRLSDGEGELLPLLAGTLSQREIGAVLHLSLNTVNTHSRLLFRKLDVSSRAEAVARARKLGLL